MNDSEDYPVENELGYLGSLGQDFEPDVKVDFRIINDKTVPEAPENIQADIEEVKSEMS
jgi:hypothetical protein